MTRCSDVKAFQGWQFKALTQGPEQTSRGERGAGGGILTPSLAEVEQ